MSRVAIARPPAWCPSIEGELNVSEIRAIHTDFVIAVSQLDRICRVCHVESRALPRINAVTNRRRNRISTVDVRETQRGSRRQRIASQLTVRRPSPRKGRRGNRNLRRERTIATGDRRTGCTDRQTSRRKLAGSGAIDGQFNQRVWRRTVLVSPDRCTGNV